MPAIDVKFGISRHAGALIDSVETDESVQVKELPGSNGEIARVKLYRKMTEGSVKGHGQLSVVPGVGDPGVSGLPTGGVTVITNVKQSENNEDFDGWERVARQRRTCNVAERSLHSRRSGNTASKTTRTRRP